MSRESNSPGLLAPGVCRSELKGNQPFVPAVSTRHLWQTREDPLILKLGTLE